MLSKKFLCVLVVVIGFAGVVFAGEKDDMDQFMKTLQQAQQDAQNGKAVDMDAVYKSADKVSGTENEAKECYFDTAEGGKYSHLKTYDGDIQISSQCTNAMLQYNEYRKAVATKAPQKDIDELWHRHEVCAKLAIEVYVKLGGN